MIIFREFRFEAAHSLPRAPEGHKCRRLHGHSYRLIVHVQGSIDPHSGWVRDFAEIKLGVAPIIEMLDHHNLNDIPGLEQSTVENLAVWLWPRLQAAVPGLVKITVWETATSGCEYAGA